METGVLDFDKLKCREHPLELISNYCLSEQCMVGLCAQCICSHTQMHIREGSAPIYKAIKDIHTLTYKQLSQYINALEADKNRIVNIMTQMNDRKQSFKNVLRQAKKDIIKIVDIFFEQAQAKFEQQVKLEQQRTGLHSSYSIEQLFKKVKREITNLISEATFLNTNKFLETVKPMKMNIFPEIDQLRLQVGKQIKQNEEFKPKLEYKKEFLPAIEISIRKLFSLSFTYLHTRRESKQTPLNTTLEFTSRPIVMKENTERPKSCLKNSFISTKQKKPLQMSLSNSIMLNSFQSCTSTPKLSRANSGVNIGQRNKSQIIFQPQYVQGIPIPVHQSIIIPGRMTQSKFIY